MAEIKKQKEVSVEDVRNFLSRVSKQLTENQSNTSVELNRSTYGSNDNVQLLCQLNSLNGQINLISAINSFIEGGNNS